MTTEEMGLLEIDRSVLGTFELPSLTVPYANLAAWPFIRARIKVDDTEYAYDRSFLIRGHSAVMYSEIAALVAEGRRVLVAERSDRYYIYVA